jgi:hypothetical protein
MLLCHGQCLSGTALEIVVPQSLVFSFAEDAQLLRCGNATVAGATEQQHRQRCSCMLLYLAPGASLSI